MNSVTERLDRRNPLMRERMLLMLFGLYLAGSILLLVFLRGASHASVEAAALAKARVAAAFIAQRSAVEIAAVPAGFSVRRLETPRDDTALAETAARLAHSPAGTLFHRMRAEGGELSLQAVVADGQGGAWLLLVPIESELKLIQEKFQHFYVIATVLAILVSALLGAGALRLSRARRAASDAEPAQVRAADRAVSQSSEGAQERLRLYAIIGGSLGIFCVDVYAQLGTAVGVAYIFIVLLSLWSRNPWNTWVAASLGTVLTVARLFFGEQGSELMWIAFSNRSLSIFAVWTVALLGLWQKRTTRAQSAARGEAAEAKAMNLALQSALERTEAAEAELLRGQRLLDDVARMARIGGWILDVKTSTPIWSPEVFRIHEVDPASPPTLKQAINFYAPEARPEIRRVMSAALKDGTPFDVTLPLITATGKRRWVRAIGAAERENGEIVRLSGGFQDISEQHEVRGRLERAINGSSDALFDWDPTSDGPVWYSPRMREMLGYGADEPFPRSMRELMTPEDRARLHEATTRHFESGEPFDLTSRLQRRSGEWLWIRARGRCERDASGKPSRFSGSLQDITLHQQAEEALLAAKDAAAAANRAKSDFLANVSHEIRTPMNGVLGMTELLLGTSLASTQREYAETIRSSATALLRIINDLLDFSKIEAGKLEIESVEMDIRACVEDASMVMAMQAASRSLEFIVNVEPNVATRVRGDPHRLRQILLNLAGNAIKFTKSGEVVVEVAQVACKAGKVLLSFEVRDTGIGMAPDVIERLFKPFTQADASTTRYFGGTGLGLSIVKRLVELMGGTISVASRPGEGSTFSFTLPFDTLSETAAETAAEMTVRPIIPKGIRVLVVDDNRTNRRVLCGQLGPAGYAVTSAANADEALSLMLTANRSEKPFDVVIVDEQMPGFDGTTFVERAKQQAEVTTAQFILLTSMDHQGDAQRLERLGFSGYMTKPVRGRVLLSCMERVLERGWMLATGRFTPIVTRGALAADQGQGRYHGRILVVEDHPVNQQVARKFLERLGCEVTVVDDGAKAVEACARETYDLVLMDVQMPVMDGLTATREIRRAEADSRHTPIIALTASAVTDELERCSTAGMDGMLTKPLELVRLREVLDRCNLGLGAGQPLEPPVLGQPPAEPQPLDMSRLREVVGDDKAFLRELCATFVSSGGQIVDELERALSAGDRPRIAAVAHKLKGGSASVCANQLASLAASLESSAREQRKEELEDSVNAIRRSFGQIAGYLATEFK